MTTTVVHSSKLLINEVKPDHSLTLTRGINLWSGILRSMTVYNIGTTIMTRLNLKTGI